MGAPAPAISPEEDLEALFDQIAGERARELAQGAGDDRPGANDDLAVAPAAEPPRDAEDLHQRLGRLTRSLHDALSGLGYDKKVTRMVQGLPDARERLNYIARLTGEAAEKTLNCVDQGQALQSAIGTDAAALAAEWQRVFARQVQVEEFRRIAERTRDFLDAMPARAESLGAVFTDIMMAQDFHDLTGQVIKKIVDLAGYLEEQLVALVVETTPHARRGEGEQGLDGPVVNAAARSDVVTDQKQVDELLEKLGF